MKHAQKGLTLLELLVALAIFALLAAMAYGGLQVLLDSQHQARRQAERLAALQLTFRRLEQDTGQFVMRGIRDQFDTAQPALAGDISRLEFTRAGWDNPLQQPRSTLQRVAWFIRDGVLYRAYWRVLDRAQDSEPLATPLLENVTAFTLRYLDSEQAWHNQWPPLQIPQAELSALEVNLELPEWGRLRRLFAMP